MFSNHFDQMVTTLLPAEDFSLFRRSDLTLLPEAVRFRFLRAAEEAMKKETPAYSLSDWIYSVTVYDGKRRELRLLLRDLALEEAVDQRGIYLERASDLLFRLLGEASWSLSGRKSVPARNLEPDSFSAESAELAAWCVLLLGKPLREYAVGLVERVWDECEDRLLRYLDDPAICEAALRRRDAPMFARAAMATCLIVPQEDSVRWLRLKNALRIGERCISGGWLGAAGAKEGLAIWMEYACAIADIALLADFACGGQSGLRRDSDLSGPLHLPVETHIHGPWFADEKSRMKPEIHGEDLYRIGAAFDDDAMCALGAALDPLANSKASESASLPQRDDEPITGRILNALWRSSLEAENGALRKAPMQQAPCLSLYGAYPPGGKGFYAALHAGALLLFLDGEPILTEGPEGADRRSVPEPGGFRQTRSACRDVQMTNEGFPSISMDIAPSYPREASLSSWQRTLLSTSSASAVRLLDAFDFAGVRQKCSLRFVSPKRPVLAVGAPRARLAGVQIEWEGPTEASVETISHGLYALTLQKSEPCAGGCWTCSFTRAE